MGRNAIHKPEALAIGERMELKGKMKKYSWQYVHNFNLRNKEGGLKFKHVRDGNKVFIEREK